MKYKDFYTRAAIGGSVTTVIIGIGIFSLGRFSGYEAEKLIKASIPGVNMLCNTMY